MSHFVESDDDLALEREAFDSGRADFDLVRAASLLARVEGRTPSVSAVTSAIELWADAVRADAEQRRSWQGPLNALVRVLFVREGLRGDVELPDAPCNSFLDEVVRRRRGIPISLSVLAVETARRAGLFAFGLALPRHFMAGVLLRRSGHTTHEAGERLPEGNGMGAAPEMADADLFFLDAFHAQILPPEDVAERVGLSLSELAEVVQPATPEVILVRMLMNLRMSYLRRRDVLSCTRVLTRLLLLKPRDAALHLERAHLHHALGDRPGALADAEAGARLARDPDEKEAAQRMLEKLAREGLWVH